MPIKCKLGKRWDITVIPSAFCGRFDGRSRREVQNIYLLWLETLWIRACGADEHVRFCCYRCRKDYIVLKYSQEGQFPFVWTSFLNDLFQCWHQHSVDINTSNNLEDIRGKCLSWKMLGSILPKQSISNSVGGLLQLLKIACSVFPFMQ